MYWFPFFVILGDHFFLFIKLESFAVKNCNSGISIKRTPYKADTFIGRTVWRGTDCFALRSNYLRKNLYKADTFYAPMVSALYRFHCTEINGLWSNLWKSTFFEKKKISCKITLVSAVRCNQPQITHSRVGFR